MNSSTVTIRPIRPEDAEPLRAIYNWAAQNTTATLDLDGRTPEQQQQWMSAHDGNPYPCLVAEAGGEAVGYAALSTYIARAGYDRTAETSVYLHSDWRGQGVGSALLGALVAEAIRRGFGSLVALITADNEASLRLHRRFGFADAGTLRRVGSKFGQIVDVAFLQLVLDEPQ